MSLYGVLGNCSCIALGSGVVLHSTSPILGVVPPASLQSYHRGICASVAQQTEGMH